MKLRINITISSLSLNTW